MLRAHRSPPSDRPQTFDRQSQTFPWVSVAAWRHHSQVRCVVFGRTSQCGPGCFGFPVPRKCLPHSDDGQLHDRAGPVDNKLDDVPEADHDRDVEPFGAARRHYPLEELGDQSVRDGEQHRGHAPFEAAASVYRVNQDVRRHEAPQTVVHVRGQCGEEEDQSNHCAAFQKVGKQNLKGPTYVGVMPSQRVMVR